MKNTCIFLLLFLVGFICNSPAQSWQTLTYSPDQDSLELNPLKGLTPLYNVNNDFPHSIRGLILGFDQIMFGLDNFNWAAIDSFLEERNTDGRFAYLQVNIDMGFNRSDLPTFLSNVPRIYYDGTDPEDGAGVPSMVVDYNNEELMTAMITFIDSFGVRYNDDPRVWLVHYGLYGIFGEWDLGFGKKFIPEGEDWAMSEANQRRITSAYETAFSKKNLVARFPENVPESQAVGYSDGLYFGGSVSDDPNFSWFFHPKLKQNKADLNWKLFPIGGEVDPDVQPIVWESYPNNVIGLPGVLQNTEAAFDSTHPTFLFQDYIFNDITRSSDPIEWENALKATKRTGYTFFINKFRLSAANSKPAVEVNIQNKGLAPMYADWEIELGYLGSNGEVQSLGKTSSWNLRTIQPDVENNYRSFISNTSIPDGTYTFVLRIVNPLETLSPQAKPVRFANTTQDSEVLGWLTLGEVTISGGSAGTLPIQVSNMTLSPATAVMGLEDQLQLTAQVFPANASNKTITWSSNRPRTASVDENGWVKSNTLSGEVEITAYTQDGAIQRVTTLSVEPFWRIPGRVEAEGHAALFNAQENPAPNGEGGGSVLGFIGDDTYMDYRVQVSEATDFVVDFRASSPSGVGVINILNEAGDSLATVALSSPTANFDTYANYTSSSFSLAAGTHTLRLDVVASAFNLNWIEFKVDPCTNFDQTLIGTTCDDGDPNTTNDVYTSTCNCEGIPVSAFTTIPSLIEAENYFDVFNVQKNPAPAAEGGGEILGFIGDDTWMEYAVRVNSEAKFVVDVRAASPPGVGIINILNEAGDSLATVALTPATANFDTYATYTSSPFTLPTGNHILRLDVVASAFNLNWIEFKLSEECEFTVGTPCDDGNPNTENDAYTTNCECVGTPIPSFTILPALIEAEDFTEVFNAQANPAPTAEGGGEVLGFIGDDTWMEYAVEVTQETEFELDLRASSFSGDGVIDILDANGNSLATVALLPQTGSFDIYDTYTSSPFILPVGSYRIRLDVIASAFNLNWIEFRISEQCEFPVGTPCDDHDPQTINDTYKEDCTCQGTIDTSSVELQLDAIHDAYLQRRTRFNRDVLRVESGSRISYLKYDLSEINGTIKTVKLFMTVKGDHGHGIIQISKGSPSEWTETNLSDANKPAPIAVLGSLDTSYSRNDTYIWELNASEFHGEEISLIVEHLAGNDVAFASSECPKPELRPYLLIDYTPTHSISRLASVENRVFESMAFSSQAKEVAEHQIWPNPFSDQITVGLQPERHYKRVFIQDNKGGLIRLIDQQDRFKGRELTLVLDLPAGIYFMYIETSEGREVKKIVKY